MQAQAALNRIFIVLALLSLMTGPAMAGSARLGAHEAFENLYRSMQSFREADRKLNFDFSRLNSKLSLARRQALKTDELAWLERRDQQCGRHARNGSRFELACATRATNQHARFLEDRHRDCVKSHCSDLDFYNTQDGQRPDAGPKLVGCYRAISKYRGANAGFIAVYTHDQSKALFPVGSGIFVTGFIRLRGRYEGRVFQPKGYESRDISADQDFKRLTNSLFPKRHGGTWAGGDTGGFVETESFSGAPSSTADSRQRP